MQKVIIIFLLTIILLGTGIDHSYAAFPVKETITATQEEDNSVKKSFNETGAVKLITHVRQAIHPHAPINGNGQPSGWQGITAFICALLAIALLITPLSVLFFPLAISAIVFGAIGVSPKRHTNTGLALAGLILGCIEILAVVAVIAIIVAAFK